MSVVCCQVEVSATADHSSREVITSVACLSVVCECDVSDCDVSECDVSDCGVSECDFETSTVRILRPTRAVEP